MTMTDRDIVEARRDARNKSGPHGISRFLTLGINVAQLSNGRLGGTERFERLTIDVVRRDRIPLLGMPRFQLRPKDLIGHKIKIRECLS